MICDYNKTILIRRTGGVDPEYSPIATGALVLGNPAYLSDSTARPSQVDNLELEGMGMDPEIGLSMADPFSSYMLDAAFDSDIAMDPFVNLLGNDFACSGAQCLVQIDSGTLGERPISPIDDEVIRSYDKMSTTCDKIEAWQLYDPTTPLHHIVNRLKDFLADIATRSATPFLHRYLYTGYTPQCILSCFATCVLYVNRTQHNAAMVMRAIQGSVQELVQVEGNRGSMLPIEKLARTQALFLHQIIRLLDGDVALRAQGEKEIPLLEAWLGDLCKVRENLGDLAQVEDGAQRALDPGEWQTWIFAESVRRTIVIANSFLVLYEMMKGLDDKDDPGIWAYKHRWTCSRHLWEAGFASEFARAWREKRHFIITNYAFEKFLQYGRAEDVDDFAKILLSVYMGVNETNDFMAIKDTEK